MIKKLKALAEEYADLQMKIQEPEVLTDPKKIATIGRRLSQLEPGLELLREYEGCKKAIDFVEEAKGDPELLEMAQEEAETAKARIDVLNEEIQLFLLPKDPNDMRPVILEVRAGTGGEEAALFAAELLRMYLRYAEENGWSTELLSKADADAGGIKEAVCRIASSKSSDIGVYGELKFESGVHRVQRIPETESKGRVHTSAASVAILPEAEEVDVKLNNEEMRVDVFRSSGPGGQSVNTTDSAIRITHIPTGLVVTCQDEKSQLKNKNKAMNILRSRLYALEQERLSKERGDMRSGQIGKGDRSEKIRTYNFPQDRITDHRLNQNFSNMSKTLEGGIGEIITALREKDVEDKLIEMSKK
ncbi:peptide chain release factor 1 [Candidatus Peregrinibacteria bacterium]|jgi:peptide chain release factor 1|nr:peptide chain release factor 1 [Candidatus Peregrinibacteria bacterium]MBT3598455.1 peptide chain release factor 1 [Candidatus Peregrinibacteria bacterium]MBT4367116.1 peptide chain release factor 1 [Candidatus Peregrinibacteria bacterium]MBT4585468.1 peptide chain release factor 1 [Candidatus Peregrinibacteria bacterium]MBT6730876.1 peptide chain release factor 1 [Candidatus Peregrinibacteria bacterium]